MVQPIVRMLDSGTECVPVVVHAATNPRLSRAFMAQLLMAYLAMPQRARVEADLAAAAARQIEDGTPI